MAGLHFGLMWLGPVGAVCSAITTLFMVSVTINGGTLWFAAGNDPAAKGTMMGIGNVSERRLAQPQIGVSVVILALGPHEDSAVSGRSRLWLPLVRRVKQPFMGAWRCPAAICAWGTPWRNRRSRLWNPPPNCTRNTWSSCTPSAIRPVPAEGCPWSPSCTGRLWARPRPRTSPKWTTSNGSPRTNCPSWPSTIVASSTTPCGARASKLEYPDIATKLVGEEFTLAQLHDVYEAVGGQPLDLANFRRKMLASGHLEDTGANAMWDAAVRPPYTAIGAAIRRTTLSSFRPRKCRGNHHNNTTTRCRR